MQSSTGTRLAAAITFGVAGCDHSNTFVAPDDRTREGFAATIPVRLTFDGGADLHPIWTADGRALLYTFERQLPFAEYPDRCLGALPPGGGQRILEWCWSAWNEAERRDGIEWGTIDADDRLVFGHHFSAGDKQPLPFSGTLYRADGALLATAQPLVELMVAREEAAAPWDYLTGLVFTDSNAVTGLTMAIAVEQACGSCPFDTTWTGADLVRLPLDGSPRLQRIAPLLRAAYLAWDRSADRFFFGRDGRIETVPTDGGEAVFVWQVPRSPDRHDVTLSGVAAAAGRIAASFHWNQDGASHSVIGMITPLGDVQELRHELDGPRWGEMSLSPDGRKLVAERRSGTERDLYLFELPE
jgi:hypothetical protein